MDPLLPPSVSRDLRRKTEMDVEALERRIALLTIDADAILEQLRKRCCRMLEGINGTEVEKVEAVVLKTMHEALTSQISNLHIALSCLCSY